MITLSQVACTWKDVKKLKHEIEKKSSSTSVLFRCKLLQAADTLQVTVNLRGVFLLRSRFMSTTFYSSFYQIVVCIAKQKFNLVHGAFSRSSERILIFCSCGIKAEMFELSRATAN